MTKTIRIQRSYENGEIVQFLLTFPEELESKVERDEFMDILKELNFLLQKAETGNGYDACLSCSSFNLWFLFAHEKTHYYKTQREIDEFLRKENEKLEKNGIFIMNPRFNANMFLEIHLLKK